MTEKALHINYKELLVVYCSLRNFKMYFQNEYVKIFSDSQIGLQTVSKMGTTKSMVCSDTVKNIWLFCVKSKIWITAAHIPGAENVIADYGSKIGYKDAEWMLNPCFPSRLSTQLPKSHLSIFPINQIPMLV